MNAPLNPDSLHFSVTQMKTWLLCPRKFEYRYILGAEPEFTPMPLAFGVAFHSALAHHYGWLKLGDLAPREEVHQRFVDTLTTTRDGCPPLQSGEESMSFDEALLKGQQMLDVTLSHPSAIAKVLSVEQTFVVDLHHPDTGEVLEERLLGVVDLVIEEDGHRVLVEHKTASKKYGPAELNYDTQLSGYAFAASQLNWGEVGLRFQVTTKTKSPALQVEDVRRDEADVADFLRTAVGVLRAIDAGVSFPLRGWQCRSCPFRARCSARRGR